MKCADGTRWGNCERASHPIVPELTAESPSGGGPGRSGDNVKRDGVPCGHSPPDYSLPKRLWGLAQVEHHADEGPIYGHAVVGVDPDFGEGAGGGVWGRKLEGQRPQSGRGCHGHRGLAASSQGRHGGQKCVSHTRRLATGDAGNKGRVCE